MKKDLKQLRYLLKFNSCIFLYFIFQPKNYVTLSLLVGTSFHCYWFDQTIFDKHCEAVTIELICIDHHASMLYPESIN